MKPDACALLAVTDIVQSSAERLSSFRYRFKSTKEMGNTGHSKGLAFVKIAGEGYM